MTAFDTHTRDQLRRSYAQAWAKHLAGSPLTPLEALITEVIGIHPEYRPVVHDAESAAAYEPQSPGEHDNPFLHMGLHLAVREQISIDRPPGIGALYRHLSMQMGGPHHAEHALMEALGEILWQAQRDGVAPDESRYLHLAKQRLAKR